jgi:flagellar hook protein FlgE
MNGLRDGLTQDVTGSWQLVNGVNAYVPNFGSPVITQDGYTQGVLQSLQIDSNGVIVGGFSNGKSQNLAQLAVASFENPAGLVKQGDTHFAPTVNSGNPVLGKAQEGGRGSIVSGVLEQSNVDLTNELTNMIVAQRGFEVNARMITTSDRILDTLVNMGR